MSIESSRSDSAQPFVGRQHELQGLLAAVDRMREGRGSVSTLVGEAGIGKTRTAQELARQAAERGVRVFWGRCFEEPGAPSYWPWLQVMREYLRSTPEPVLREIIDYETSCIAELVPELTRRLVGLELPPALQDAAQARYRLFDAITLFWTRAGAREPIAIVFDNVHWADAPSLRLLEFLVPELERARLMILVTYRDHEVSRGHPLARTLAEFSRLPDYQRFALSGLTATDTEHMLTGALGNQAESGLAAGLHAQTDGLPLYIVETLRFLTRNRDGSGPLLPSLQRVPEGIRAVIGSRLNGLTAACLEYLTCASVMGRRFDATVLARVLSGLQRHLPSAEVLEEALAARIIDELPEPGQYLFTHALIRETLYDETATSKRMDLHRRTAEALETIFPHETDALLSVLVHHYHCAALKADSMHLADLALRAAKQAESLLAHEEAAKFYQIALRARESAALVDPQARCDLLLTLGRVLERSGDASEALRVTRRAFDEALAVQLIRIVWEAFVAYEYTGQKLSLSGASTVAMYQEARAELNKADDALRAQVLSSLARALAFMGRILDSNRAAAQAIEVARKACNDRVLATTLVTTLEGYFLQGDQFDIRRACTDEACALATGQGDRFLLLDALAWRIAHLLESGEPASPATADLIRVAEETRTPLWIYMGICSSATQALMEGRFSESEALARRAHELGRRLPGWDASAGFSVQMFNLYLMQGRLKELAPVFVHFMRDVDRRKAWRPGMMMMLMALDQRQEAAVAFHELVSMLTELPRDGAWATTVIYLAEGCVYLDDVSRAQTIYDQLIPYDGRNVISGFHLSLYGPVGRLLGMLATVMKHWEAAERHFIGARALATRQGARPALAQTEYAFARMLAARDGDGDRGQATELAKSAEQMATTLGMAQLQQSTADLLRQLHSQAPRETYPAGLSRREVQVLRLVAEGRSNQEIADVLVRSPNTVANHVRNILAKVNAVNRTEAATFAARHGLLSQ